MIPMEWKTVHEIKGEEGHALRIQRRGDRRPQYSLQLGRERRQDPGEPPNDRLLPFFQVRLNGNVVDQAAVTMVQNALDWIKEDAAKFESSAPPDDRSNGNRRDRDAGARAQPWEDRGSFSPFSREAERHIGKGGDRRRKRD